MVAWQSEIPTLPYVDEIWERLDVEVAWNSQRLFTEITTLPF